MAVSTKSRTQAAKNNDTPDAPPDDRLLFIFISSFSHLNIALQQVLKSEIIYCKLTAFIFLAAFLAQTFSKSFVVTDYYTNTSKYAKNCENKAKPQMHCNGKCQMIKKLQQEEKKDQENADKKGENKNEVILSSKSFFIKVSRIFKILVIKKLHPQISDCYAYNFANSIFHPPKV